MNTRIIMDNGKVYEVEKNIEDFISGIKNSMGITYNTFIKIGDGIQINPSHISSMEEILERVPFDDSIIPKKDSVDLSTLV